MSNTASPSVAVFARSRYRSEALAFSINARTGQTAFPLTRLEPSAFDHGSTVLMEVDTNIESTSALIRTIRSVHPHARIVVLGISESEENIVKFAEAGASGYVAAGASFDEMLFIISSVRSGDFLCTPDVTHSLFCRLAALAQEQVLDSLMAASLTIRERQIMALLTRDFTNKEIGRTLCVSEFTVKNHVHHLLTKLQVRSRRMFGRRSQLS